MLKVEAIFWKSSKQEVVAMSITKSRCLVASKETKEVDWIKKFIGGMEVVASIKKSIEMLSDNTSVGATSRVRYVGSQPLCGSRCIKMSY